MKRSNVVDGKKWIDRFNINKDGYIKYFFKKLFGLYNNKNIAIFVSARDKSTRLKNKEFKRLTCHCGDTVIDYILNRLLCCFCSSTPISSIPIVLCTSYYKDDYKFVDIDTVNDKARFKNKNNCGIAVYAGHPDDKLDRYYSCMEYFGLDGAIIIDGDNLFTSFGAIKYTYDKLQEGFEYVYSNYNEVPDGLYCYGISKKSLEAVMVNKNSSDTEVWGHLFKGKFYENEYIFPYKFDDRLRLTLDYEEDFDFFNIILDACVSVYNIDVPQILNILTDNEDLYSINCGKIDEYKERLNEIKERTN